MKFANKILSLTITFILLLQNIVTNVYCTESFNNEKIAKAIYTIGTNMITGKNMLDGTNLKFDEPKIVKIPYYEYTK